MPSEVVKFTTLSMPEVQSIAQLFAESGMFPNMQKMAAAFVKIQAGQEMGIAPFAAMSGIHLVKERPVVGSNIIAGKFKASEKYDYKIKELTNEICTIDFYEGSDLSGTLSFSTEDAAKAGTQNMGKFPKNMLFARCISNGYKFFAADLFSTPVYVEGEIPEDARTEDAAHEEVKATFTDLDALYRGVTSDPLHVERMIAAADDAGRLRSFYAVNSKFFKDPENKHLEDMLKAKGVELAGPKVKPEEAQKPDEPGTTEPPKAEEPLVSDAEIIPEEEDPFKIK